MVPIYNTYDVETSVEKPIAYIIPQGWWKVIERLQLNGVQMNRLENDTELEVETYRITDYKSMPTAFEAHHVNSDAVIEKV